MKREIFELDELLLIETQQVAKQHGKTLDEAVADALRQWVDANRKPTKLGFIGMFDSAELSSDPEEIERVLMEGLDPYEGWLPDSRDRRSEEPSGAAT